MEKGVPAWEAEEMRTPKVLLKTKGQLASSAMLTYLLGRQCEVAINSQAMSPRQKPSLQAP